MLQETKPFVGTSTSMHAGVRADRPSPAPAAIGPARIDAAKRAFTTRRVDFSVAAQLIQAGAPRPGDLVLARVDTIGQHTRIEWPNGRRANLYAGDEIIVAYGARYAPDQFEADVPTDLGPCDLVAGGGVAARVSNRHAKMRKATGITPIGLIADAQGNVLNLARFALPDCMPGNDRPTVIVVAGTSMNAGKTTTAAGLIHGLTRAGLKVGATKVTGTGSGGDIWSMIDAGAATAIDFTDMGHASTAGLEPDRIEQTALSLIAHLAADRHDIIVLEIADGVLQSETAALLRSPRFAACVDAVVFAAGDALGAIGGVNWLREHGHVVAGVSGLISISPLASREAEAAIGQRVVSLEELMDPVAAPMLCFARVPALSA